MPKFPSTILAQTNDPKEIQKADLDLLDKINQLSQIVAVLQTDVNSIPVYVPVPSEPSLGTPHRITTPKDYNTLPGSTAIVTVDLSSFGIPIGAKAVSMRISITFAAVPSDQYMQLFSDSAGIKQFGIVRVQTNAMTNDNWCMVPFEVDRNIYFSVTTVTNLTAIVIRPEIYWI